MGVVAESWDVVLLSAVMIKSSSAARSWEGRSLRHSMTTDVVFALPTWKRFLMTDSLRHLYVDISDLIALYMHIAAYIYIYTFIYLYTVYIRIYIYMNVSVYIYIHAVMYNT